MKVGIIDACGIVNLIRSGGAGTILNALSMEIWFEGLVEDEIIQDKIALDELVDAGLLHRFDGSGISATAVGEIAGEHDIGVGEAECITICVESGETLISDDKRARAVGQKLLGEDSVTGIIGLLCRCIDNGAINPSEASKLLENARTHGGFLPEFDFERRELVA